MGMIQITNTNKDIWLAKLFDFMQNNSYTLEEISTIFGKITSYYIEKSLNSNKKNKNLEYEELYRMEMFLNYLDSIKEKLTFEYLNKAITSATQQESYDFIDGFIRYIVITNLDDIRVVSGITKDEKSFYTCAACHLGDYQLAQMDLMSTNYGILFDNVIVDNNVRRLGIGTALFKGVMEDIHTYHPDKRLYANDIIKENEAAIEFYSSLGADISISGYSGYLAAEFSKEDIAKIVASERKQKNKK